MSEHLIFLGMRTGAAQENMALDEALLMSTAEDNIHGTIRFYTWQPCALSFGYFQKWQTVISDNELTPGIDYVRRPTGGKTIDHTGHISYAVIAKQDIFGQNNSARNIYLRVNSIISNCFERFGIHTTLANREKTIGSGWCFEECMPGDIMAGSKKVLGSAQRRVRGALLMHGSFNPDEIGLKTDEIAELPDKFADVWRQEFIFPLVNSNIPSDILKRQAELVAQKYSTIAWNHRR
jgi:lipoate-protein ligase A